MAVQRAMQHSIETTTLADLLERILDKGIVIAGDIKIKLVDVELLTIQIRLVICSVDKAKEIGLDWWEEDGNISSRARREEEKTEMDKLRERLAQLEKTIASSGSQV